MARKNAVRALPEVPTQVLPVAELLAGRALYNPRRISDHDASELQGSIASFGLVEPLVWNRRTRTLVGGHQRLAALERLGVARAEAKVVDLDPVAERRLNLLLNRSRGEWDWPKLQENLRWLEEQGVGLSGRVGFTDAEVAAIAKEGHLLELSAKAARDELDALTKPEDAPEEEDGPPTARENAPAVTRRGDVWLLGPHRLLCADSTAEETWHLVSGGGDGRDAFGPRPPVACVLTDPPYAIYGSSTGLEQDGTDDRLVRPFFEKVLRACGELLPVFGHAYVCCDWRSWPAIWDAAKATSMTPKNALVWDKGSSGLGNNYANTYELVGFFSKAPRQTTMSGGIASGQRAVLRPNVLRFPRVRGDEREHNAAKPVGLFAALLANSTDEGGHVVNLFGGSGTTLLAAEQTKRVATVVDVEPRWCDVAARRYERATGVQAVLAETGERFDQVAAARGAAS